MRLKKWPVQISQKIASQTHSHMIQGSLLRKSAFVKGDTNNSTHTIHLCSIMDALVIWFYYVSAAAALLKFLLQHNMGKQFRPVFTFHIYLFLLPLSLLPVRQTQRFLWFLWVCLTRRSVKGMHNGMWGIWQEAKNYRQQLETLLNQSNVMLFLLIVCVATDRRDCL